MSIMGSMPSLQVQEIDTYYEKIGSGSVLILLHGWANSWESWLPIIPLLSDHFTLILPDLPGCGKTATPADGWTTAEHAKWLDGFVIALENAEQALFSNQQSRVSFGGHSYGGKILLEYSSGLYSRVPSKLLLMDASGIPSKRTLKQRVLQFSTTLIPQKIKEGLQSSVKQKMYEKLGLDSDYAWANAFQKKTLNLILREDYTEKLASIACPTLILWGKNDSSTPVWQGESMHTLIPLNQFHVFDAGHFPHHDFPKEVSQTVTEFLL